MKENLPMLLTILAFLLSGIAKSIQDTISYHWERSKFMRLQKKWPRTWKWFRSDWKEYKPILAGLFKSDAWHVFELVKWLGVGLMIGLAAEYWLDAWITIFYLAGTGITFLIFYNKIWLEKYP